MSTLKITTLTALVLATGLGLSACTTPTNPAAPAPTSDVTEPQTPDVTAAPAPVLVAGATITTDAEQAAAEAAGLGVFPVFDAGGTWVNSVVFDKAAPLPDPIKAAIVAPVVAAFDAAMATGVTGDHGTDEQNAAVGAISSKATSVAQSASRKAGRNIVIVFPYYGSLDGVNYGTVWSATTGEGLIWMSGGDTSDASIAGAQAWIATQPNPETYEIVVTG